MKELEGDGCAGHGRMVRVISEEVRSGGGEGEVNQGHNPVVSRK